MKVATTILRSLGLRKRGLDLVACPSCGRAEVNVLELTQKVNAAIEREQFTVPMRVAVMGCVVNGPGEAREADVGIASGNGLGFIIRQGEVVAKVPESELVEALLTEARAVAAEKVAAGRGRRLTPQSAAPSVPIPVAWGPVRARRCSSPACSP